MVYLQTGEFCVCACIPCTLPHYFSTCTMCVLGSLHLVSSAELLSRAMECTAAVLGALYTDCTIEGIVVPMVSAVLRLECVHMYMCIRTYVFQCSYVCGAVCVQCTLCSN